MYSSTKFVLTCISISCHGGGKPIPRRFHLFHPFLHVFEDEKLTQTYTCHNEKPGSDQKKVRVQSRKYVDVSRPTLSSYFRSLSKRELIFFLTKENKSHVWSNPSFDKRKNERPIPDKRKERNLHHFSPFRLFHQPGRPILSIS